MKTFLTILFFLSQSTSAFAWVILKGHETLLQEAVRNVPLGDLNLADMELGVIGMDFPEAHTKKFGDRHRPELRAAFHYDSFSNPGEEPIRAMIDQRVDTLLELVNVRAFAETIFGVPTSASWHDALIAQPFHFLRGGSAPTAAGVSSKSQACEVSKSVISKITHHAMLHLGPGYIPQTEPYAKKFTPQVASFWLGLAIHTIQDAYSPAHVLRDENTPEKILDICTYGFEVRQNPNDPTSQLAICVHEHGGSAKDFIWSGSTIPTSGSVFSALKWEAQEAVYATQAYLTKIGKIVAWLPEAHRGFPPEPNIPAGASADVITQIIEKYELDMETWQNAYHSKLEGKVDQALNEFFHIRAVGDFGSGAFVCPQ